MIRCDAKSSSSAAARWRGPSRGNAPPSRPPTCTAPSCSGAPGAGSLRHGRIHRHHSPGARSEEHTSELQSRLHLVCRLLLEKKKKNKTKIQLVNKVRRDDSSS